MERIRTREQVKVALEAVKGGNFSDNVKAILKKSIVTDEGFDTILESALEDFGTENMVQERLLKKLLLDFHKTYIPWRSIPSPSDDTLPIHPREKTTQLLAHQDLFQQILNLKNEATSVPSTLQDRLEATQRIFLSHLQLLKRGFIVSHGWTETKLEPVEMFLQLSPDGQHLYVSEKDVNDQIQVPLADLDRICLAKSSHFADYALRLEPHNIVFFTSEQQHLLALTTCLESIAATFKKQNGVRSHIVFDVARLRIQELSPVIGLYQAVRVVQETLTQAKLTFPLFVDDTLIRSFNFDTRS